MIAAPVERFLQTLNRNQIRWCSWKSNEHIDAGLRGDTDLDLLFDPAQATGIFKALDECGYIFFEAPPHRRYPDIFDAVAMDPQSGKLIHVHAHFAMVVGEKHLKSYTLPWTDTLLGHRHIQETVGGVDLYATDPVDEMILLILRESLKRRVRDKILQKTSAGAAREFEWLKSRIGMDDLRARATELLGPGCAGHIMAMAGGPWNFQELVRLRPTLQDAVSKYRRMNAMRAIFLAKWRETVFLVTAIQSRLNLGWPPLGRMRTLPGKGLIVAVTGIDGSGKSSVTDALYSQWRKKVDVEYLYFGTGDGPKTLLQRIMLLGRSLLKKEKEPSDDDNDGIHHDGWPSVLWAIACALGKRSSMRRAMRLRHRGVIVICDRFPQNEIMGMNDGPMLSRLLDSSDRIRRRAARLESWIFAGLQEAHADLILKLTPSLETAMARKPHHAKAEILSEKRLGFESITYPCADRVRVIDADGPFDDVLLACKTETWNLLENTPPRLVESIGLPGSGKTTTVNALAAETTLPVMRSLDMTGAWKSLPLLEKGEIFWRGVACEIPLWMALIRFMRETESWKPFSALKIFLKMPFQRQWIKYSLRANTLWLDQWLVQSLWSALLNANALDASVRVLEPLIREIYRDIPVSFMLHALPPQEAAQRIAARSHGNSRFDGRDITVIGPRLANAADLMETLAQACRDAGFPVETINGEDSVEEKLRVLKPL